MSTHPKILGKALHADVAAADAAAVAAQSIPKHPKKYDRDRYLQCEAVQRTIGAAAAAAGPGDPRCPNEHSCPLVIIVSNMNGR